MYAFDALAAAHARNGEFAKAAEIAAWVVTELEKRVAGARLPPPMFDRPRMALDGEGMWEGGGDARQPLPAAVRRAVGDVSRIRDGVSGEEARELLEEARERLLLYRDRRPYTRE